jgi:hypothetical protein
VIFEVIAPLAYRYYNRSSLVSANMREIAQVSSWAIMPITLDSVKLWGSPLACFNGIRLSFDRLKYLILPKKVSKLLKVNVHAFCAFEGSVFITGTLCVFGTRQTVDV